MYTPNLNVPYPCFVLVGVCRRKDCRYYVEMTEQGKELYGNCALKVANEGAHTLGELSDILGVSKERVRQKVAQALRAIAWRATQARLTERLAHLAEKALGDVLSWPPKGFTLEKVRYDDMAYVELGDDVYVRFVRPEHQEKLSQRVLCPLLSSPVRLASCFFCEKRSKCPMVKEYASAKITDYFESGITSVKDVVARLRGVKPKPEPHSVKRAALGSVRERILSYLEEHPDATPKEISEAVGASLVYVRKVLMTR
ncbi:MAG: hypothetical protein DRG33_03855 [Deltaproteobacteria bacterium]|nr:MAG: hypothetical protein DRG33_03855 [Deltaproteobacteria bacterium]